MLLLLTKSTKKIRLDTGKYWAVFNTRWPKNKKIKLDETFFLTAFPLCSHNGLMWDISLHFLCWYACSLFLALLCSVLDALQLKVHTGQQQYLLQSIWDFLRYGMHRPAELKDRHISDTMHISSWISAPAVWHPPHHVTSSNQIYIQYL